MTFEAWLKLAETGQTPANLVRKDYSTDSIVAVPSPDVGTDSRRLRFTVSSSAVDRERDVINQAGWMLDNFRKNPVVLFGHDYSGLPVAKATDIRIEGDTLIAEAEFATAAQYPFAETVYQMVKGGFLNATSVGFRPLKWVKNEERQGYDIEQAELFEFSIVPVPANPDALVMARSAGIDLAPLAEWATKTLTAVNGDGVWLSKAVASKVQAIAQAVSTLAAEELPESAVLSEVGNTDVFTKKGRVLSAKNEAQLRQCMTLLEGVLKQLDNTQATDEPVMDPQGELMMDAANPVTIEVVLDGKAIAAAVAFPSVPAAVEPDPVSEPAGVVLIDPPIEVPIDSPVPSFDPAELDRYVRARVRTGLASVVTALTGRLPD